MNNQNEKRLYIEYNKGLGVWCIYNTEGPMNCIPLDGYTDEHNDDIIKFLHHCSDYWSEYYVPIGIFEKMNKVIAQAKGDSHEQP